MSQVFKTAEKKTAVKNSTGRVLFAALSILLQVLWVVFEFSQLNRNIPVVSSCTRILAFALVLWIYSQNKTSSMKMPWIILILLAPIFGITLYLMVGLSGTTLRMRRRFESIDEQLMPLLHHDSGAVEALDKKDPAVANIARYLERFSFPLYRNSHLVFYDNAAEALEAQKEAMSFAKHFIFMEYHAIEDAESWAGICEILAKKAAEGVDVRVFYDDAGSTGFINQDFVRKMESMGIACRVFNPIGPVLNIFLNNRDHRKITVIDGKVGFTGGYNLANEYFNVTRPYGHWKDTGIKITGEAVQTLTVLFLEMWNAIRSKDIDDQNFKDFLPEAGTVAAEGFIQPYADSPMDDVQVGEDVYLHIINSARRYVYFMTPYLIITDEMTRALTLAAGRGVDVRIITPGIPDKKMVYNVTRSYYSALVRGGVRIYEYTPGFVHAKQCVCDDKMATCGTINLDYRSLYHHFENGCFFAFCGAVDDMKADFRQTFDQSREVTWTYLPRPTREQFRKELKKAGMTDADFKNAHSEEIREYERERRESGQGTAMTIWRAVLRLFAELM